MREHQNQKYAYDHGAGWLLSITIGHISPFRSDTYFVGVDMVHLHFISLFSLVQGFTVCEPIGLMSILPAKCSFSLKTAIPMVD